MNTTQNQNLLLKEIKKKFGLQKFRQNFPFFPHRQLISTQQTNYLILKFAPKSGDFFDQPCFYPFIDSHLFMRFRGKFFCSTLPLTLKLLILESLLKEVQLSGDSAFKRWTEFFDSTYNKAFLDTRNMEWESLLAIGQKSTSTFSNQ